MNNSIKYFRPMGYAIFLFVGILVFTMNECFAQEDTTQYPIKIFETRQSREKTELNLKAWQFILKLKTYVDYRQLPEFKEHCDTSRTSHYVKKQDSTVITLKSGLSWILEEGPPEEPRHYHWKLLSKKGRNRPGMQDRIRYMQFVARSSELDDLAYDMIRELNMYYSFTDKNGKPCLKVYYTFQPNDKNKFDLINREVKVL